MKTIAVLIFPVIIILAMPAHQALANGHGGGESDYTSVSDFESNRTVNVSISFPQNIHLSRTRDNPSKVTLTKYQRSQFGNKVVKSNWQTAFEWIESIGDISTSTTQGGIYVYAVYCWYVGEAVILVPVAICWHGPKHLTRTIYGIASGKLETVHEVNDRSFGGRIANGLVIEALINQHRRARGQPIPYPGPTRTHLPEKDIIYFRGVK